MPIKHSARRFYWRERKIIGAARARNHILFGPSIAKRAPPPGNGGKPNRTATKKIVRDRPHLNLRIRSRSPMPPKIRNGQHAPSAPYCRFGELGFGKSVIFFRILNNPCRRFIGEGRKIFFIGRHRLSLLAKPAKNTNIATIKDISLPPLAFSLFPALNATTCVIFWNDFRKILKNLRLCTKSVALKKFLRSAP